MKNQIITQSGKLLLVGVLFSLMATHSSSFGADAPNPIQAMYSSSNVINVFPDNVSLGSDLDIEVHNLAGLSDAAIKSNQKIKLYLNNHAIKGLVPEVDSRAQTLRFTLSRTDDSKEVWNKLLGKSLFERTRTIPVTVGLENGTTLMSDKKITLVVIKEVRFYFWLVFLLILAVTFCVYGNKSAMLRNYDEKSPFSLAYCQMAFWFFLILFAYLFIWVASGEWNTIPESILTLLGIATGTTLGARVIDNSKLNTMKTNRDDLENQIATLKDKTQVPQEQLDSLQKQLILANGDINRLLTRPAGKGLLGFLNDILNDKDGISLHRFQNVVWTLVFGFIFVAKVLQDLGMPEFSATQLALIGISSGTYLGFKLPEQAVDMQAAKAPPKQ
jgi:hypothetical protein